MCNRCSIEDLFLFLLTEKIEDIKIIFRCMKGSIKILGFLEGGGDANGFRSHGEKLLLFLCEN
jgi:hypothetical protein